MDLSGRRITKTRFMNYDEYINIIITTCKDQGIRTIAGPSVMELFYYHGISTYKVIDWCKSADEQLLLRGRAKGDYPYDKRCDVEVGDRVIKTSTHYLEDIPAGTKGIVVGGVVLPTTQHQIIMIWWEGSHKDTINNIGIDKIRVL